MRKLLSLALAALALALAGCGAVDQNGVVHLGGNHPQQRHMQPGETLSADNPFDTGPSDPGFFR